MAKTWLITGVSTGFGRELSKLALARGDRVVGTLRNPAQVAEFEALAPGRAKAVLCDVTDVPAVNAAVAEAIAWTGGIDELVNNAGYALIGAFEEASEEEFRHVIEVNLFGTINVIRAALPHMRERRKGDIINFSSAAGIRGLAAYPGYCTAKFAVAGLTEALKADLGHSNIRVMVVEPGAFSTDFRNGSVIAAREIEDYREAPSGKFKVMRSKGRVGQAGDPVKLARNLLTLLDEKELPAHFPVADGTHDIIAQRDADYHADLARWKHLGVNVSMGD